MSICKIHLSLYRYKTQLYNASTLAFHVNYCSQLTNIFTTSWSDFKMFTTIRTTSIFYYFMVLHLALLPSTFSILHLVDSHTLFEWGSSILPPWATPYHHPLSSITVKPVHTHHSNPTPEFHQHALQYFSNQALN